MNSCWHCSCCQQTSTWQKVTDCISIGYSFGHSLQTLRLNCNITDVTTKKLQLQLQQQQQLLLHSFNGLFSRTTWVSWHQKGKPFWILLEWGWQGGSISWTICKSYAHCSRQIITPVSHHLVFYRLDIALPATQPTVSKHWCVIHMWITKAVTEQFSSRQQKLHKVNEPCLSCSEG